MRIEAQCWIYGSDYKEQLASGMPYRKLPALHRSIKHDFQPGEAASASFSVVTDHQVCDVAAHLFIVF